MAVNGTGSLVILVIVFLGALAFQAQVEGKPQENFHQDKEDNVSRVIDHTLGEDAEPEEAKLGQFPWQVLILTTNQKEETSRCSGSIIDQKWIMSAAHCIVDKSVDEDGDVIANGYENMAKSVRVFAGVIDRNEDKLIDIFEGVDITGTGEEKRVFIHKDYNIKIRSTNDIALLKLKKPLTITNIVKPILLATAEDVIQVTQEKKSLTASGWGQMSYGGYKPYQSGKYWNEKDCKPMKEYTTSLETCKTYCAINDHCTVFLYVEKQTLCILQNCDGPIPEPTEKHKDMIGYTAYDKGKRYYRIDKFWTKRQCPRLRKMRDTSLETCKTTCDSHKECNVFRYHTGKSMCVLQQCAKPLPEPKGKDDDWIGYFISAVYEPHQSGKYWNDDQCANMGKQIGSLEICKRSCTKIPSCNAFNYMVLEESCDLKNCDPTTEPKEPVIADGFIGFFFYEGSSPNILRYVTDLELKSKQECGTTTLSETMICQQTPKKSVFVGDSGGPVTFEIEGSKPPINVQIGIISFGIPSVKYSAVFTNVANLRPWIHTTMSGYSPPGFFISSSRWYRLIKDEKVTWDAAMSKCHEIHMQLAEPKDYHAVQLREDTFDKFGDSSEAWVGAQGDSKEFTFVVSKTPVADSDLIAHPFSPTDKDCLWLDATKSGLDKESPYYATLCSNDYKYALCQVCDDPPDDQDLTSGQCEENGGRCIENGGTCEFSIVNLVNSVDDKCVCCLQACSEGFRAIITRSGSKQCVLITSCPEDEDFFTLPVGGSKQCFKVLKELATWEKANKDCIYLNLTLAEPFAPVQLRSYIVQEYGTEFFVWLGACQDKPIKMMWKRSGEEITDDDPLWYPGQPDFDEGCLLLLSSEEYLEEEPEKPFWNVLPKYEFYPLCELVLE